ncbi:MAG: hypothetical protein RSB38_06540 [Oscillospiraceae bacterium]
MRTPYKQFVQNNIDTVFTVEYEERYPDHSILMLKEDETNPKWFFSKHDLIRA